MTAEQYFIEVWGDIENGKLIKPMFLEHFMTPDDVIQLMQNFAKLKCAEQRQICADEAKINVNAKFKEEIRNTQAKEYFYDFKDMGGKRTITVFKDSIINAKEPEI